MTCAEHVNSLLDTPIVRHEPKLQMSLWHTVNVSFYLWSPEDFGHLLEELSCPGRVFDQQHTGVVLCMAMSPQCNHHAAGTKRLCWCLMQQAWQYKTTTVSMQCCPQACACQTAV